MNRDTIAQKTAIRNYRQLVASRDVLAFGCRKNPGIFYYVCGIRFGLEAKRRGLGLDLYGLGLEPRPRLCWPRPRASGLVTRGQMHEARKSFSAFGKK
jgi:hypothetical protein